MRELTLGSLFSGSGGFELAGAIFGIKPLWESEIEPLPIRVTERNFPDCLMLGDISKIHGWAIPKVDIITGGSPCQDMSIAGKRDGLGGNRSVLFNEQIRIVKEMREDDRNAGRTGKDIRCRWMCWENVPGAFTSNKRRDFQAVLTEIIRIAEPKAPPVPIPGGAGHTPELSWEPMDSGRWPTERWTQNSGEFPKDAPVSTLSQILQERVDPKYCLTAKACLGILRRADKRGKPIIPILRHALERQAEIMAGWGAHSEKRTPC